MSQRDNQTLSSSKVIGLAAAAGSTVAGLALAMSRRRAAPPPPRGVQALLTDPRLQAAADVARASLGQARERAMSPEAQALRQDVLEWVGQAVDSARSELPPLARQATEAALVAADRVRAEGSVRSADLGERLKAEVAPVARELAQEAISEAEDILAAARERAADLGKTARSNAAPQFNRQTAAIGTAAAGVVGGLGQAMGKTLGNTMRRRAPTMRPAQTGDRILMATSGVMRSAGSQLKYVAGESAMIGLWAGALGGVVYFGLLDTEQRARVRRTLRTIGAQARELIADLRADEPDYATGPDSGK